MQKKILLIIAGLIIIPFTSFAARPSLFGWLFGYQDEKVNKELEIEKVKQDIQTRIEKYKKLIENKEKQPETKKEVKTIKLQEKRPIIGFKSDDNFIVNAPTEDLARQALEVANKSRLDFYGRYNLEIPEKEKFKISIHVNITKERGVTGSTWCVDSINRKMNLCWVMTGDINDPENYNDFLSAIAHETQHALLANTIKTEDFEIAKGPFWAHEMFGTAADTNNVRKTYCDTLEKIAKRGDFSNNVKAILNAKTNSPLLHVQAFGLGLFLSSRDDESKKLELIQEYFDNEKDWEMAFNKVYGFENLNDLQNNLNNWLKENIGGLCNEKSKNKKGTSIR